VAIEFDSLSDRSGGPEIIITSPTSPDCPPKEHSYSRGKKSKGGGCYSDDGGYGNGDYHHKKRSKKKFGGGGG
jgi:hypothetical protein